jgi:hypothetical protein
MQPWQSIKTAPKDGTLILGWSEIWSACVIVRWRRSEVLGDGWELHPLQEGAPTIELRHWAQLPPPPRNGA